MVKNGKLYQDSKNKAMPKNMKKPRQNMQLNFNNTNKPILNMMRRKRRIKRNKKITRATLKRHPKLLLVMKSLKKTKLNLHRNPTLMKTAWEVYDYLSPKH